MSQVLIGFFGDQTLADERDELSDLNPIIRHCLKSLRQRRFDDYLQRNLLRKLQVTTMVDVPTSSFLQEITSGDWLKLKIGRSLNDCLSLIA